MAKEFNLRNGTLLLTTEAPGGIYNSAQLKKIAELCDNDAAIVKATEDQRIALFVQKNEAEQVADELRELGLGIRHYQSGLHQPTACIGELCPHHQQDALGAAMSISEALGETETPAPLKIGVNGCPTCCVPCHTLDISLVGDNTGYRISLGGKNSQIPEFASFMADSVPAEEIPGLVNKIVVAYQNNAEANETLQDVMERCGAKIFIDALAPYSQDASVGADPFASEEDSCINSSNDEDALASDEGETNTIENADSTEIDLDLDLADIGDTDDEFANDEAISGTNELDHLALADGDIDPSEIHEIDRLEEVPIQEAIDVEKEIPAPIQTGYESETSNTVSEDFTPGEDESALEELDTEFANDIEEEEPLSDSPIEADSFEEPTQQIELDIQPDLLDEPALEESSDGLQSDITLSDDEPLDEIEISELDDTFEDAEKPSAPRLSDDEESLLEERIAQEIDATESFEDSDRDINVEERRHTLEVVGASSSSKKSTSRSESTLEEEQLISDLKQLPNERNSKANPGQPASHTADSININAEGTLTITFQSGMEVSVDPNRMSHEQPTRLSLGGKAIILTPGSDGFHVEIDGIDMFIPFHQAAS